MPRLGRIHLSGDRDGLRPEMKIIGYAIAEVYAHPACCRGLCVWQSEIAQ